MVRRIGIILRLNRNGPMLNQGAILAGYRWPEMISGIKLDSTFRCIDFHHPARCGITQGKALAQLSALAIQAKTRVIGLPHLAQFSKIKSVPAHP